MARDDQSRPGGPPAGSLRTETGLGRIPRNPDDDYGQEAVEARLALCEAAAARSLPHVRGAPVERSEARGNIENLIGYAQVPLGIAGPLQVDTSDGPLEVLVPMATTEGAMVAAYSRGMRLFAESARRTTGTGAETGEDSDGARVETKGGESAAGQPAARARVLRSQLSQTPILVYRDAEAAQRAAQSARESFDKLAAITSSLTNHGQLAELRTSVVGRRLVLDLGFTTGDAIGINMAAQAADRIATAVAQTTGASERYVHGQDVEKRAHARGVLEGRGRSVVCDVTVPRQVLLERARVSPEDLAAIARSYAVGYAQMATHNWLVQSANGIAAVMLACGQDVAYVTESANGQLTLEVDARGDLYASVTLPSLLVGTVGGGTAQGTAAECLDLLGCRGSGRANRFAEILAATVLAGDLSLMASFCAHEFVGAHERLGRNRPEASR